MSRYLTSAVEQALWSLLNLGVNLLLIRVAAPDQYGAFSFWANIGFVLASLQNALTVPHIQVLSPGVGTSPARLEVERLMHGVTVVFLALVGLGVLAAALVFRAKGSDYGAPAAALFVPAFLLQQYVRLLAFSRGFPRTALIQTAVVLVLGVALVGGSALLQSKPSADEILIMLALAYGLVGLAGGAMATRGQGVKVSWPALKPYRAYAANSGWLFLGVTTTELLARFSAFAVAGALGAAALASLSATQLLLRPLPLLASSWSLVARGDLVRRREVGDLAGFGRILMVAIVPGLVIALSWSFLVSQSWDWICGLMFKGKYAGDGQLVLLWGVASALSLSQVVASTGLQILRAYRDLALANTIAALAAAAGVLLLLRPYGIAGAISGAAIGQGVEVALMAGLLARRLRLERGQARLP